MVDAAAKGVTIPLLEPNERNGKMILEIKQVDIDKGEPGNPCNCAVARSAKRLHRIPMNNNSSCCDDFVEVEGDGVVVFKNREIVAMYSGGNSLEKFIDKFDGDFDLQSMSRGPTKKVKPTRLRLRKEKIAKDRW